MGGTATETEGPFGTELVLVVPVEDPEGQIFSQTSRVIGVDGPRWLLRATVLGRAAVEPDAATPMEETLRNTSWSAVASRWRCGNRCRCGCRRAPSRPS